MPTIRRCCIVGCGSNSRADATMQFFQFPKNDAHAYRAWMNVCQSSLGQIVPFKKPVICARHFEPRHVGGRRLIANAVPTLHLEIGENMGAAVEAKKKEDFEHDRKCAYIEGVTLEWLTRVSCDSQKRRNLTHGDIKTRAFEANQYIGVEGFIANTDWLNSFFKHHMKKFRQQVETGNLKPKGTSLRIVDIVRELEKYYKPQYGEYDEDDSIQEVIGDYEEPRSGEQCQLPPVSLIGEHQEQQPHPGQRREFDRAQHYQHNIRKSLPATTTLSQHEQQLLLQHKEIDTSLGLELGQQQQQYINQLKHSEISSRHSLPAQHPESQQVFMPQSQQQQQQRQQQELRPSLAVGSTSWGHPLATTERPSTDNSTGYPGNPESLQQQQELRYSPKAKSNASLSKSNDRLLTQPPQPIFRGPDFHSPPQRQLQFLAHHDLAYVPPLRPKSLSPTEMKRHSALLAQARASKLGKTVLKRPRPRSVDAQALTNGLESTAKSDSEDELPAKRPFIEQTINDDILQQSCSPHTLNDVIEIDSSSDKENSFATSKNTSKVNYETAPDARNDCKTEHERASPKQKSVASSGISSNGNCTPVQSTSTTVDLETPSEAIEHLRALKKYALFCENFYMMDLLHRLETTIIADDRSQINSS